MNFEQSAKRFLGADAQQMTKAMDAQPDIDNARHVDHRDILSTDASSIGSLPLGATYDPKTDKITKRPQQSATWAHERQEAKKRGVSREEAVRQMRKESEDSEPGFKGSIEQLAKSLSKHRYFEDRLEYPAEELARYYSLTPEQGKQLYQKLHQLAAGDAAPQKKLTPEEHAEQIKKKDPFQKKGVTTHSVPGEDDWSPEAREKAAEARKNGSSEKPMQRMKVAGHPEHGWQDMTPEEQSSYKKKSAEVLAKHKKNMKNPKYAAEFEEERH
jgi:hypothetical protein